MLLFWRNWIKIEQFFRSFLGKRHFFNWKCLGKLKFFGKFSFLVWQKELSLWGLICMLWDFYGRSFGLSFIRVSENNCCENWIEIIWFLIFLRLIFKRIWTWIIQVECGFFLIKVRKLSDFWRYSREEQANLSRNAKMRWSADAFLQQFYHTHPKQTKLIPKSHN